MTQNNKKYFGFLILILILVFDSVPVQALNVQSLRPSSGQTKGYHVLTSETLPKNNLSFGLNFNLAHHPLERTAINSTARIAGVVDQFVTADILVSYGVTDWLTINGDFPVNLYHNIAPTFIPTRDKGGADPGDLYLSAKFRLYNANKTKSHLGLALIPFVSAPTGRESVYFGDSSLTGGLIVAGDLQIKANRFYVNAGTKFRKKENIDNGALIVGHELLYGAGFERPISKKIDLDVTAEIFGSTKYSDFSVQDITSPLEGMVTLKKRWLKSKKLLTLAGVGVGITNGYSLPVVRGTVGVSYLFDLNKKKKGSPFVIRGQVNFQTNSAVIKKDSNGILDSIIAQIKAHPEIKHIQVAGHTDAVGTESFNLKLSARRSNAVKNYMIKNGIDAHKISNAGYGETKPMADNSTEQGRYENRRTEFWIE